MWGCMWRKREDQFPHYHYDVTFLAHVSVVFVVTSRIPLGLPSYMDFNTAVEYIYAEVMSGVQHTGAFQEAWTAEDRVSLVACVPRRAIIVGHSTLSYQC